MPPSYFASPSTRRALALLCLAAPLCAQQSTQTRRTRDFLAQRLVAPGSHVSPAQALIRARTQHAALTHAQDLPIPHNTAALNAPWTPLGPIAVTSPIFGALTGRITALALDPNDTTGNTLYAGATGGGVWKSTNAAGPLAAVTFSPLTDTLPAFSNGATASLSIGALAIQPASNPVLLAGTGDPNDATDSFYGEGLLRSADGGHTWTLISQSNDGVNGHHSFAGLATAAMAFSTTTPSLAVAAMSISYEGAIVNASTSESIPGLYVSTDAGLTWQMATVYDGSQIVQQPLPAGTAQPGYPATGVVWDPLRNRFFAAIQSHGYYSSPDGITWTRLAAQPGVALTAANCPSAFASAACPIYRGVLAVQPATGDLYALTVDADNNDQGLWQDLCNAAANTCADPSPTFSQRIDHNALETGNGLSTIAQGDYNLVLAAVPTTSGTNLYAGTIDLYRCALAPNGSSCTFRNTTNALNGCTTPAAVAPAQHALAAFAQPIAPVLFLGNDGGLWRSLDGVAETGSVCSSTDASHFDNLNASLGSLAEVVGFAEHPTDPDTLLAGLGELGSAATTAASTLTAWPELSAGEGGFPSLDPNTPTNWTLAIGAGINLKQCTLGASCTATGFTPPATVGEAQVAYDTALLDAPALLDPNATTNVLLGTCRIWRGPAASGSTWSTANAISKSFDGTTPSDCTAGNPLIRSIGAGGPSLNSTTPQFSGSEVLYAGLTGTLDGGLALGGSIFVTTAANQPFTASSWTNIARSPVTNDLADNGLFNPGGFDISSLAVDAHDATGATVYATIMGFYDQPNAPSPHLYRSTDFGAHWLNITANLPDAPANSALVDPNDANTVYVATDTGVYVTTAITTCATTNCWSPLGTGLPYAPAISLAAAAQQPTGDGRLGMLRVSTYGRGIWQIPLLTAISIAHPSITLSTTSLAFGTQQDATESAAQTVIITSSGNAPATFGQATLNATSFTITSDNCSNRTIAVNASCNLSIAFVPGAIGTTSGTLTIYADIAGGQAQVALTGTGTSPANITLDPASLTFAATIVNQTTAPQIITVNNTGGNIAALQTPSITGDFAITQNTCGASLGPSTSCSISIAFTPTATGARTGAFSITDISTGVTSTQTAPLSGTGDAPATDTLSPTALTFAQQQVSTVSPTQQVTLTNSGDVALSLLQPSINSSDFTVTGNCGTSLPGRSTCAYSVAFAPTATGTRSATLTLTDTIRSQTVALTGTGIAPPGVSLSPATLSFANTGNGLTSLAQTVTLTNNGGVALTFSKAPAVSSNFAIFQNNCGASLAVSASCSMQIVFAPAAAGPLTGSLTLTDNAPSSTQTVSLSGVGIDFTFASNGAAAATLTSGSSATYPLLLSSLPSVTGNVAFTCTGVPVNSLCTVSPSTPALGGTTNITATVQTGVLASLHPQNIAPWRDAAPAFLALLLPFAFAARRNRLRRIAAMAFLLFAGLGALSGCGSGRAIPASSPVSPLYPTPSGTYNITVTATSAGIAHAVTLTLTVQ